jgi:hypothetical protein
MNGWCTKHTLTKAVLTNDRPNEVRIRNALKNKPMQEGDKFFLFFKSDTERCLLEDFDGVYSVDSLLKKLYDTLCIFETILDLTNFKNYKLVRNKKALDELR